MLPPSIHRDRRTALRQAVQGPILLMGCGVQYRNLPLNSYPFRQDSTFLYFTGCVEPGAALLMDHTGDTLFLPAPAEDDALWHGHVRPIEEIGARLGFSQVAPAPALEDRCRSLAAGAHTLAVPDARQTRRAAQMLGQPLSFGDQSGSQVLVDAVIGLRRQLSEAELVQMRAAAKVTDRAHRAVMAACRPGVHERELVALFEGILRVEGAGPAYPPILTVDGEILHNFHYINTLEAGRLLLLDGGAEVASGYAGDVTRTWPVSGRFSARQRSAYDAVLASQLAAIDMVRAGVRYRDIHDTAARVLAQWLADEGLLRCSADQAVETGAHAVFFPHGVGHLIGLDVHDLENFGDRAAYPPGRSRSEQFGTAYLRMDLDLAPGMVVTIEPGFYVVPAILGDPTLRERFRSQVDFDRAEDWAGFGGIRIEDDVAVTTGAPEVLSQATPKTPEQLEALVGTGSLSFGAA